MSRKREQLKRERSRRAKVRRPESRGQPRRAEQKLLEATVDNARQTVDQYLRRDDLAASVVELAGSTRELALRVMRRSPLDGRHECRPGCAFCCYTAVTVAP